MAFCVLLNSSRASVVPPNATSVLDQTEHVRTSDHPRFVRMLEEIHRTTPNLTSRDQWHLRYLDAWQLAYQGDYSQAEVLLQDVIDHSGDQTLIAKASALLMANLAVNSQYEKAFTLANRLAADLPNIHDKLARFSVLANLSQVFGLAGQSDLALKYSRMMEDSLPEGESLCNPRSMQANALHNSGRLTAASPELQNAIDTCLAAGQTVFANTMYLVKAALLLKENQPEKALPLLKRMVPSVNANHYYSHILSLQVQIAQAYWKLGNDNDARTTALAALSMSGHGDISTSTRDAYDVLYQVEKKRGNTAAALFYYEHYAAQDKGYLDDVSAKAMAYQVVQQHILAKKLETEELNRQNNVLRLQQALDTKAVETSRLYITLLLVLLASIVFWLYRIKRSQLRFKWLSHRDGLTGILNYQYFVSEAERVLRQLEKKSGEACLISIDLDHFKRINDTHGHAVGDAVLRHTVTTCQHQLRPTDLFGRLGGEEFGILLRDCPRERGMEVANRIRMAIGETPMEHVGCVVSVFASVGLAATDVSGYNLQRLCMEADAALYRAKRGGRNRVIADIGDGSPLEARTSPVSAG